MKLGSNPSRGAKTKVRGMDKEEDQAYEMKLRILGKEIFAISLSSTSTSSRWIIIALVSIFCVLTILGAYGEKIGRMYHAIAG